MDKLILKVNDVFLCTAAGCTATILDITDKVVTVSAIIDNEPDLSAIDVTMPLGETLYGFDCGEYVMKP